MPELPEVETIVRSLAPRLAGRRILEARFRAPRVLRGAPEPDLAGCRIASVTRQGKHILLHTDRGVLAVHLGMTGRLLLDAEPTPYIRAEFQLDGCALLFEDVRQFGRMAWGETLPPNVAALGPDALGVGEQEFAGRLRSRRGRVKGLLLRQDVVSGLGNIYVDEALHRAGIHPLAEASRLSAARLRRLHAAVREVLSEAVAAGGSSISDYVDADGRRGGFQERHRVYGRAGKPCLTCGRPVEKMVVAQRGTHLCPHCQK